MRNFYIVYKVHSSFKLLFSLILLLLMLSCNESHVDITEKEIVETPEEINAKAEDVIHGTLKDLLRNDKDLGDSFRIRNASVVQFIYDQHSFKPLWSARGAFTPAGDSMFAFINNARRYGLFPEDYDLPRLERLKNQLIADTSSKEKKLDASMWAFSDMLLTASFVQAIKDIKVGRLLPDSVVAKDTTLTNDFFLSMLNKYRLVSNDNFVAQLEPQHSDYQKLKKALRGFLDTARFENYTLVRTLDSSKIPSYLIKRLSEEDSIIIPGSLPDSARLVDAIKRYQKRTGMKETG